MFELPCPDSVQKCLRTYYTLFGHFGGTFTSLKYLLLKTASLTLTLSLQRKTAYW